MEGVSHPPEGSEASGPEVDPAEQSSSPPALVRGEVLMLDADREFLDEEAEILDEWILDE